MCEALLGGRICFLPEGLPLYLELADPALHLVDLGRHAFNLHPETGGGLIDEIDGLVRQEAVGDVPMAQNRGRDQGRVLDPDAVMHLVLLLEAPEDRNALFYCRLTDDDRLKPSFQSRILLDPLPILVQRGGTDAAEFTAGQRRLEHVGSIYRPLGGSRPDQSVQLVDKADDLPLRLGDLLENCLQPVFKFPTVFGPGNQRADV